MCLKLKFDGILEELKNGKVKESGSERWDSYTELAPANLFSSLFWKWSGTSV